MNYAYLDKYGILHISDVEEGGRLEVEIPADGGFPTIEGKQVYMYSLDEVYVGGNRNSFEAGQAKKVNVEDYPQLKEVYIKCKDLKDRLR